MPPKPRNKVLEIHQSVCRWCYDGIALSTLAEHAAAIGLKGIDLVEPSQWEILRRHGLLGTMTPTHPINAGLNDPANHNDCLAKIRNAIEATSAAGFPNVICFSGNRNPKISDKDGQKNCAKALKRRNAPCRAAEGQHLHGAPQQQTQSSRIHVRPHGLGRGIRPPNRFASL